MPFTVICTFMIPWLVTIGLEHLWPEAVMYTYDPANQR